VMRTLLPALRTEPSRMCATLSSRATCASFTSLPLVGERRGAGNRAQLRDLRQQVQQLLRDPIREILFPAA
jgi:hypothetical protein